MISLTLTALLLFAQEPTRYVLITRDPPSFMYSIDPDQRYYSVTEGGEVRFVAAPPALDARLFDSVTEVLAYLSAKGIHESLVVGCYKMDADSQVLLRSRVVDKEVKKTIRDTVWDAE